MLAALLLAASVVAPASTPVPAAFPTQTPPPEPDHLTITATISAVEASQKYWQHWDGIASQFSGLYEFQVNPRLRLANTLRWERLSTQYTLPFRSGEIPWRFNEYDDELDVELGPAQYPTGVGIGYYDYNPVYDARYTYDLAGFGVGIDRWANWYVPRSFYFSAWYYPNVRGSNPLAGTYGIGRVDVGLNVRQNLESPWGVRIGLTDEDWFANDAKAQTKNFVEPYLTLTWWK